MLMLQALRNRAIALLWGGQAASAIGDEIYRMALIWLAIGLVGTDSGYPAAGHPDSLHSTFNDGALDCGAFAFFLGRFFRPRRSGDDPEVFLGSFYSPRC
jgi:hypothetical protein